MRLHVTYPFCGWVDRRFLLFLLLGIGTFTHLVLRKPTKPAAMGSLPCLWLGRPSRKSESNCKTGELRSFGFGFGFITVLVAEIASGGLQKNHLNSHIVV